MDRRSFLKKVGTVSAAGLAGLLYGCAPEQMGTPEIVGRVDYGRPKVGEASPLDKPIPEAVRPGRYPRNWYPEKDKEKKWRAIVVHHSATETGCASVFHHWHKYNLGWDGIGYDFVIGNGTGSGDGEIEATYRWRTQVTGAHCKAAGNWANEDGIGICLVGDFNKGRPTRRQLESLTNLVSFLQKRYGVPGREIYGHRNVPRLLKATDCPGRNFPFATLNRMLAAK